MAWGKGRSTKGKQGLGDHTAPPSKSVQEAARNREAQTPSIFSHLDIKAAKHLLLAAIFALVVIGVIMVYSATSATLASKGADPFKDMITQLVYVTAGIIVLLFIWHAIPYRQFTGNILWIYYAICILLLILTFAIGETINGAKRWLNIGPIGIQPSEFAKVAFLLMTIRIVNDVRNGVCQPRAAVTQFVILILVPLVFLFITQSDLGTTAICVVGIFAVLWLGGMPGKWLAALGALVIVAAFIVVFGGESYRGSRFVFLNPWDDGKGGLGPGYNLIHAYYAIAEGGLFGVGIGSSHEKYGYLFGSDSDFIFAVIGEELGLVGAMFVIAMFLLILICGLRIASEAHDHLAAMIAGGCVIMLVFQAFLNIACAIGVFPTTGKPLPFISSGGSSIMSSFMLIGMVLAVEKDDESSKDYSHKRDNLRVVRTERAPRAPERKSTPPQGRIRRIALCRKP